MQTATTATTLHQFCLLKKRLSQTHAVHACSIRLQRTFQLFRYAFFRSLSCEGGSFSECQELFLLWRLSCIVLSCTQCARAWVGG